MQESMSLKYEYLVEALVDGLETHAARPSEHQHVLAAHALSRKRKSGPRRRHSQDLGVAARASERQHVLAAHALSGERRNQDLLLFFSLLLSSLELRDAQV